jgi:hypothetical protein
MTLEDGLALLDERLRRFLVVGGRARTRVIASPSKHSSSDMVSALLMLRLM